MIQLSDLTDIFESREEHIWEDLRSESEEENVATLISEAENCYISESERACVVMLWSASIEKLKWILLMFSKEQLRLADGLKDKEYHAPEDFNEIKDSELIDAAENLELLDSNESLQLQTVRSDIRNKCAHGDDVELDEETIILIEHMIKDYIFDKSDSAGITVRRTLKIIEQRNFPEKMLEDVEYFSQNKQSKLANQLYDKRKSLPLKRMNARENYQANTDVWNRSELDKRDLISDCISLIWPRISADVKKLVKNRARQDALEKEGARGFILEVGNSVMPNDEFSSFLKKKLFTNYSNTRKEDVNDVVMSLWLCNGKKFPPDEEIAKNIWHYGVANCYAKKNTRLRFNEFATELNEDIESEILNRIEKQIEEREKKWGEKSINLITSETILQSTGIDYLINYYDCHSNENKIEIFSILRDTKFSKLKEVEDFLEEKQAEINRKNS